MAGRETGFDQSNADWKAPEAPKNRPIKVIKKGEAEKKSLDLKLDDIQEVKGDANQDQFLGQAMSGTESLRLDVQKKKEYKDSGQDKRDARDQWKNLFKD